jgi:hypothetical protein
MSQRLLADPSPGPLEDYASTFDDMGPIPESVPENTPATTCHRRSQQSIHLLHTLK